ncbi:hypothetical protein VTO42DRAFT_2055 [Malbranchea cinnamomea]
MENLNPNAPLRAPWRDTFESHLARMKTTEFSLATVYRDANGKVYPRVRTCMFRSFWAELTLRDSAKAEMQQHNQARAGRDNRKDREKGGENPPVYESDMLAFTTDVRMAKVDQILSENEGAGGEVEAMFWVKDAMTQWRLNGRAFIVGGDREDNVEKQHREQIWKWMRPRSTMNDTPPVPAETDKSWNWENEITAHFANMSPVMRGTFKSPPPGIPRFAPHDSSLTFGQEVYDLHDPVARSNFRVVVIQPWEVEYLDLQDRKRFKWALVPRDSKDKGKYYWRGEELWP